MEPEKPGSQSDVKMKMRLVHNFGANLRKVFRWVIMTCRLHTSIIETTLFAVCRKDICNIFPHRLINIFKDRLGDISIKPELMIGMLQFIGLA